MNGRPSRVVLATARSTVRQLVGATLAMQGAAVLAESDDADLVLIISRFCPDLVVTDLDGRSPPPRPVIWLPTAHTTAEQITDAWRRGAVDIAPDPTDIDDIVNRIGVAIGATPASEVALGDLSIDEAGHVARRAGVELVLTATEFRLLMAFVTNAGLVLSKPQLLRAVWGFDDYDVNLVEVHVSALRRKLEERGDRVIHTVRGIGYVARAATVTHRRPALRTEHPPHQGLMRSSRVTNV